MGNADENAMCAAYLPSRRSQRWVARWVAAFLVLAGLAWLATAPAALTNSVLWLNADQEQLALAPYMELLEDPGGELTLDQVSSPACADRFQPLDDDTLNLGVTQSAFWLRFDLGRRGEPDKPQSYVLDLGQPFLTFATLYAAEATAGGAIAWQEIHPLNRAGRPLQEPGRFLNFRFALAQPVRQMFYLRLQSLVALDLIPKIVTEEGFREGLNQRVLIYGILAGILLGLAGYHLVIFLTLRDRSHLWYVLIMLMAIIYFLGMNGIYQVRVAVESLFVNRDVPNCALSLMFIFRILFAKSFLPLQRHFPKCDRLLSGLALLLLSLGVLVTLESTRLLAIKFFMVLGLIIPVLIVVAGVACWRAGFRPARFFTFAYFFSGLGSMLFVVGLLGRLSFPLSLYHIHQLALCLEAVLLALALGDRIKTLRRERQALEQTREAELRSHQQKLRAMVSELINAEERERRRIAEDLHDSVTQDLTADLWRLRNLAQDAPPSSAHELEDISESLDQSLQDIRSLTFEISPPELYDYGLSAALNALSERLAKRHGLVMDFRDDASLPRLPEGIEVALFRMGRELLLNAVKHAEARRVEVRLGLEKDMVILSVADDGVGFPPRQPPSAETAGFGLFSIRERLRTLGGTLGVFSGETAGSQVSIRVPLSLIS